MPDELIIKAEEADDDVDDDDEDYEPSEIEKLAMMDEDEYVAYMLDYITEYKKKQGK